MGNNDIGIAIGYGKKDGTTVLYLTKDCNIVGYCHPDDKEFITALLRDAADAVENSTVLVA